MLEELLKEFITRLHPCTYVWRSECCSLKNRIYECFRANRWL